MIANLIKVCILSVLTLSLCSCASTVAQILPVGQPITKERCENLPLEDIGFKDGSEGQRMGPTFESWRQDCRGFQVKLDKTKYEAGYSKGLVHFCSCEKGFDAGVRGEFVEMRGQFYMCKKAESTGQFSEGHKLGSELIKDPELVKIDGVNRKYNKENIEARAITACQARVNKTEPDANVQKAESPTDSQKTTR